MTIHDIDPNNPSLCGCMATISGRIVNLLEPKPEDILLEDIAHGLAHNFRWNGHTKPGYTIAEHCLRVAARVHILAKPYALFHDAEEAYWGDMIRPLKMVLREENSSLIEKMRQMRILILELFDISANQWIIDEVKDADNKEMSLDFKQMFLEKKYLPMPPDVAKAEWFDAARNVLGIHAKFI